MEKIIFFGLAIPILGFVFYLGGTAIMKGFKAKVDNRPVKPEEKEENETQVSSTSANDLSDEISKLNELLQSGVLTQEEFEKARKENAEVLGYEATGTPDTKKQTLKMAHQLKENKAEEKPEIKEKKAND